MERITDKKLKQRVKFLNEICSNKIQPFDKNSTKWNTNRFELDYAYGGVQLVYIISEEGAQKVVSSGGYETKRSLYNQINTIINFQRFFNKNLAD